MSSTALERRDAGGSTQLFQAASAGEMIAVASDVAAQFSDIVRKQRMFKRIGDNDHIMLEAWQTIGALTGVAANEAGGVEEIGWRREPQEPGAEPPLPGREPNRERKLEEWQAWKAADVKHDDWELRRDLRRAWELGRAFGWTAKMRAVKDGVDLGWGQGICDRSEDNWAAKPDQQVQSMAQTRAQSKALGVPLRWTVKLAGYETTPAEELDGAAPATVADPAQAERIAALEGELTAAHAALAKAGETPAPAVANDEQEQAAADSVRQIAAVPIEAEQFILAMGQHFNGVPEACVTMLRGLARFVGDARARAGAPPAPAPENAPPAADQSAYHQPPTSSEEPTP